MTRRGTTLDTGNRFISTTSEPFDDGWDSAEENEDRRTELIDDNARTAFATNSSPDIPFTHSINPYRGCEHGCSYCLAGDTLILMADGSTRELKDLKVGDRIYGTERRGTYRHYAITTVLDHWTTHKPAYRITLNNGTTLVASGDHRFLTERGWKYVTGAMSGRNRRPFLTTGNKLMGYGGTDRPQPSTREYQQGYLCGMVRGDGHLASYEYQRPGRENGNQYVFRLALKDLDALERTATFLTEHGIGTTSFQFQPPTQRRAEMHAIQTRSRENVELIRQLVEWPTRSCLDWQRGFLGGIFDAEGSYSQGALRISNTDLQLIRQIEEALSSLQFQFTRDVIRPGVNRPVHGVRLLGGLHQQMRFFQCVGSAIVRKRTVEGTAIKSSVDLGIALIEPLDGTQDLYDITTGTGDFIANGVVSHNCYARPTHEYLGYNAGLDFETKIIVKRNAAALARQEMMKKSWTPTTVSISGVTDPYQPVERELKITRSILETMLEFRNPVGIVTKNAGVLRDLDILSEMAKLDLVAVFLSITTLDRDLARRLEPRTSTPERRLDAVRRLSDAGIPVGVMMAPLIPGLTDEEIPSLLKAAADAGAREAFHVILRLPLAVRPIFLDWLEREQPGRAAKVRHALEDMRGGVVNITEFGKRMSGTGARADMISNLFAITARRLGLGADPIHLTTEHFRRLAPGGQLEMFGS